MKQDSKKAFYFSIGYVGFATILLYSMYPSDPFAFEGLYDNFVYLILSLLAIPGQLLSWSIRFAGSDSVISELLLVLLSQLINVVIWWRIILYVKRK